MKEIISRAKRIDNGKWVEGFYSQLPKPSLGATIITNGDLCAEDVGDYIIVNRSRQHSNFSNAFPIEVVECEYYEIDPETLCQYTGLKDKNGNRIWENDIVSCEHEKYPEDNALEVYPLFPEPIKYKRNYAVEFINTGSSYGYRLRNKSIHFMLTGNVIQNHKIEVVGNIFDNPELLKGGQSCTDL